MPKPSFNNCLFGTAQERIGRFLIGQCRRHTGQPLLPQSTDGSDALLQGLVLWLYRHGEPQVCLGIFMGTVNSCRIRQRGNAVQRG